MSRRMALGLALSLLLSACAPQTNLPPEDSSGWESTVPDSTHSPSTQTEAPATDAPTSEPLDEAIPLALRQRRDELEAQLGITIALGDEIPSLPDHTAAILRDEQAIGEALTLLSQELARYPDGFLADLGTSEARQVVICLTGALTASNADYLPAAGSLYTTLPGQTVLAYDLTQPFLASLLHHEISHAIEARLRELLPPSHALFTDWPGEYLHTYHGHEGKNEGTFFGESDPDRMHYISSYAKTFPQEDRAVLFEYLMFLPTCRAFESPHIRGKLSRYLDAIGEAFAFSTPPEWELTFAALN